jgi:hypothetical protein
MTEFFSRIGLFLFYVAAVTTLINTFLLIADSYFSDFLGVIKYSIVTALVPFLPESSFELLSGFVIFSLSLSLYKILYDKA